MGIAGVGEPGEMPNARKLRCVKARGPDSLGRYHYTLAWVEPGGVWRPEPGKEDGRPVGYRRGQCFFARPEGRVLELVEEVALPL